MLHPHQWDAAKPYLTVPSFVVASVLAFFAQLHVSNFHRTAYDFVITDFLGEDCLAFQCCAVLVWL